MPPKAFPRYAVSVGAARKTPWPPNGIPRVQNNPPARALTNNVLRCTIRDMDFQPLAQKLRAIIESPRLGPNHIHEMQLKIVRGDVLELDNIYVLLKVIFDTGFDFTRYVDENGVWQDRADLFGLDTSHLGGNVRYWIEEALELAFQKSGGSEAVFENEFLEFVEGVWNRPENREDDPLLSPEFDRRVVDEKRPWP